MGRPSTRPPPSTPRIAAHHPYLLGFWGAQQDRIGYWLTHPSKCVESPDAVVARLAVATALPAAAADAEVSGGDVDADWASGYFVGDETPAAHRTEIRRAS